MQRPIRFRWTVKNDKLRGSPMSFHQEIHNFEITFPN